MQHDEVIQLPEFIHITVLNFFTQIIFTLII